MQKLFKNEKEDIEMAAAPILTAEQQLQELIAAGESLEGSSCGGLVQASFYGCASGFAATAAPQLLSKLKRMQEALEFYADPENILYMKEYGFLEYGEQTEAEQHTNKLGTRARKALMDKGD